MNDSGFHSTRASGFASHDGFVASNSLTPTTRRNDKSVAYASSSRSNYQYAINEYDEQPLDDGRSDTQPFILSGASTTPGDSTMSSHAAVGPEFTAATGVDTYERKYGKKDKRKNHEYVRRCVHNDSVPRNYIFIGVIYVSLIFMMVNAALSIAVEYNVDLSMRWWLLSTAIVIAIIGIVFAGLALQALKKASNYSADYQTTVGNVFPMVFIGNLLCLLTHALYFSDYGSDPIVRSDPAQMAAISNICNMYIAVYLISLVVIWPARAALLLPEISTNESLFLIHTGRSELLSDVIIDNAKDTDRYSTSM
jgi:hypothetical protein